MGFSFDKLLLWEGHLKNNPNNSSHLLFLYPYSSLFFPPWQKPQAFEKTACLPSDTNPGREEPASAFSTTRLTTVAGVCARDPPGAYQCFTIFEKGKKKTCFWKKITYPFSFGEWWPHKDGSTQTKINEWALMSCTVKWVNGSKWAKRCGRF